VRERGRYLEMREKEPYLCVALRVGRCGIMGKVEIW